MYLSSSVEAPIRLKTRIDIGVGIILLAGILTFAVARVTVRYQSVRATLANPVESLRSE